MKRKINQVGTGTLTVSLPAKWARENNLKKGDEIELDIKGKSVVISAHSKPATKEITVKYASYDDFLRRLFLIPYIRGYNKIKIQFNDPKVFDKIQDNMHLLFGFEIVDQQKDCCILQHIAKESESEFKKIFSRLFNVVDNMIIEAYNAIEANNYEELKRISRMESLANRLAFLCRRMIHQEGFDQDYIKFSAYSILLFLEDITDHLDDICNLIAANAKPVDKEARIIFKNFIELFKLIRDIYHKEDITSYLKQFKKIHASAINKVRELKYGPTASQIAPYAMCILSDFHNLSEEVIYGK